VLNAIEVCCILSFTPPQKFSFVAKQLFISTTDFAGNTLWSFTAPRASHLQTRWPPLTSLLLLPARFRSASWSLRSQITSNPSPESGHLSRTTTHHHGNHPSYRPICGTLSSSHEKPTTNVWTGRSSSTARHSNSTCPIYPLLIANTTQWLQSYSRHCPQVGSQHGHSCEFPCLEVSHPPHRKRQPNR